MTNVLAISGTTIFLIFVIAMVAVLAYTAFSRSGQSNISQHPVDSRGDVPAGAEEPSRIASEDSAQESEPESTSRA